MPAALNEDATAQLPARQNRTARLDQLLAFDYTQMAWGHKVETQVANLKSVSEFRTPCSDGANSNVNNKALRYS